MRTDDDVRAGLATAVVGRDGSLAAADRLCHACVEFLEVDGAAITLMLGGVSRGTYGSSSDLSKQLDEFQFTFGEGPSRDAVRDSAPVHAADLRDAEEQRWPAFAPAALDAGVSAVFSLPILIAHETVGALDLFRHTPGPLDADALSAGLLAADLAVLPILSLMNESTGWPTEGDDEDAWTQLASMERVEVYQATGMLMARLEVGPAEALLRLRARAFSENQTASQVAWSIVEKRMSLESDEAWWPEAGRSAR